MSLSQYRYSAQVTSIRSLPKKPKPNASSRLGVVLLARDAFQNRAQAGHTAAYHDGTYR